MANTKIAILILMGLGAATFGASYGVSLWLGASTGTAAADVAQGVADAVDARDAADDDVPEMATAHLGEKHLMALVQQVRSKLDECRQHEKDLEAHQRRLQVAREDLRKEAQHLETLRARLASAAARLKESRTALEDTRLAVQADEQRNLKHTAEIYDVMEAEAAAQIIENMCKNQQHDDAAKILHFMKERSVGKLLAAISDPNLVADLCQKMKRIREPEQGG
jgi:flagellar motility protein MotE (MotC chaperone)